MKRSGVAVLMTLSLLSGSALAKEGDSPDRTHARSMVISKDGIVASENPIASAAGAHILEAGGNAIDAAIAANAVVGLVEPMMNGIGGDLFAIVYDAKTHKLYGLNSSGWAPQGLTPAYLHSKGYTEMPQRGIDSVTVPGAVSGWDALSKRFGRKKLGEDLQPAIALAREGVPIPEISSAFWENNTQLLSKEPDAAAIYLPGGHAPRVGEVFKNPGLAWSLSQIAKYGRKAFYNGPVGARILATSRAHGGVMTATDLAGFQSEWVEPISTTYHGWRVYELPPNDSGIAALEMLNIMERLPLAQWGPLSVNTLHAEIEAQKLAYADMHRYVGDMRFAQVPVAGLLNKQYASERAKLINPARANCNVGPGKPPYPGADTQYLSVVDREGNMVSLIQSNFATFGSGIAVRGGGFALQNRGGLFTLEPGHPNVLAPHKRPVHTIIPAFMEKGSRKIAFGIMGGWNQSQAHAQFVSNVTDFDMNLQQALDAPRFTKLTFSGCDLFIENRVPQTTLLALSGMGHQLTVRGAYSDVMGGGQAVMRDFATRVNYGGSDARKDGEAIPALRVRN